MAKIERLKTSMSFGVEKLGVNLSTFSKNLTIKTIIITLLKTKTLNDELQIHISVKWMVQILIMVFTLTGAWFTINASIESNSKEIEHLILSSAS